MSLRLASGCSRRIRCRYSRTPNSCISKAERMRSASGVQSKASRRDRARSPATRPAQTRNLPFPFTSPWYPRPARPALNIIAQQRRTTRLVVTAAEAESRELTRKGPFRESVYRGSSLRAANRAYAESCGNGVCIEEVSRGLPDDVALWLTSSARPGCHAPPSCPGGRCPAPARSPRGPFRGV